MGCWWKNRCAETYPHVGNGKDVFSVNTKAFGAEYAFTFLLVSSVIHAGVDQQPNDFYGMTIGFTVLAAVQLIGPISGACLNPAVWFGTIVSAAMCVDNQDEIKWGQIWIYLPATILGGITAGVVYRLLYYEAEPPSAISINQPELRANEPGAVINAEDIWGGGSSSKSERF